MDNSTAPCRARLVPRAEFERATSCVARAEKIASEKLQQAQDMLRKAEAKIASRLDDLNARIALAEETAFRDLVDHTKIASRAAEAAEVLEHAARFQEMVDDAVPHLVELVETSLTQIVGRLDPGEVLAATVAEAVAELKAKGALTLRVAPDDYEEVVDLVADAPDRFSALAEIVVDSRLAPGSLQLDGRGGFVEIGLATQIAALRFEIERMFIPMVEAAE